MRVMIWPTWKQENQWKVFLYSKDWCAGLTIADKMKMENCLLNLATVATARAVWWSCVPQSPIVVCLTRREEELKTKSSEFRCTEQQWNVGGVRRSGGFCFFCFWTQEIKSMSVCRYLKKKKSSEFWWGHSLPAIAAQQVF